MSSSTDIDNICGCKDTESCNCDTRHPLERDGTSQAQRLLAALDPSYVAVDERSLSDLLVFALNYAKLLNYYDYSNTAVGDWEVFLKRDISVIVSIVSKENIATTRLDFQDRYKALVNAPDIAALEKLYAPYTTLLDKLNTWYNNSDARTLFHSELNIYFQSIYLDGYLKLAGVAKGVVDEGLAVSFTALDSLVFNEEWQELYDPAAIESNTSVFNGATDAEKIASAAEWIKPVFEKFTSTLQNIIERCPVYLEKSIEDYPYHKPHAGLFITFLHLFSYAQKHINGITERHLDFFYDEVLQLAQKEAVADKVHVIFELAKSATEPYKVSADTILKAGKDETGVALFYGTDDDIIVNKAKVAGFRNLYIDNTADTNLFPVTGIFASSVANSSDGKGGELDKTVPEWKAFGSSQQGIAEDDRTMPEARLGFAIASPQLLLSEGKRIITLLFSFSGTMSLSGTGIDLDALKDPEHYQFLLTGAKAWMEADPEDIIITPLPAGNTDNFTAVEFTLTLPPDLPAITAYNSKFHKGSYDTSSPVLAVVLPNYYPATATADYTSNLYAAYEKAIVRKIEISLSVSEMSQLSLHNDFSKIDPTKPFQPFGQQPVIGSTFYAGSEEIFFKSLNTLTFDITWHGPPDDFSLLYENYADNTDTIPTNETFIANGKMLEKKQWGYGTNGNYSSTLSNKQLFQKVTKNGNTITASAKTPISISFDFGADGTGRAEASDIFDPQIKDATRGFIKLELAGSDFLQDVFPLALASKAIAGDTTKFPKQPYSPTIKSFSVSFTSTQVLDSEYDQFFHLQPFGEQEIDVIPQDLPGVDPAENQATYRYFFPQFVRINDINEDGVENSGERTPQKAMLFIALENLEPQQSVAMLAQVVENSSNPKVEAPEINWAYLRDNEWVQLSRQQVFSDTSNGFLTSGIIELDIPEDATNDNTILPSGYHWLRASVDSDATGKTDPSALCNLLDIQAQAIQASFRDRDNDPKHLEQPLVALSITKLDEPVPEIKSAGQPFASFGGKVKEEGNDYYRRVSERLRHKGRAITMWDYERLVLENYPSIYKVKCISHTLDEVGNNSCYLELAPGNVCVIVVSNLRNKNQVDLLKPSTGINTRKEIKEFLEKRASKFARIKVIDPSYQAIQVKSNVYYLPEYQKDKGYYDKLLVEDIKKFLSPWAYDEGADIVFGGKIHASYIINFIEERSYVDYLTDFTMYMIDDDGNALAAAEELAAANSKSILVSADTHLINPET